MFELEEIFYKGNTDFFYGAGFGEGYMFVNGLGDGQGCGTCYGDWFGNGYAWCDEDGGGIGTAFNV